MTIGFFGKIPATGDFVSHALPRVFTDRWDRWISMELRARPDEGELFTRAWRFSISANIFGDQPCAGAWCMSRDRVGRRYPFAIVRIGQPPGPSDPWFDKVAACLLGAVEEQWPPSKIVDNLVVLPALSTEGDPNAIVFWSDDWDVAEFRFVDIYDLAENALPAMRSARSAPEALEQ